MFTGIIEETGFVRWLRRDADGTELRIEAPEQLAKSLSVGDSLAVNGVCLTLTARRKNMLSFDVLEETLRVTNLGNLRAEEVVNLERPLEARARLGGHFVQGHVDVKAAVLAHTRKGEDTRLEVEVPKGFEQYVVYKGSIAINGVSLTIAEANKSSLAVWLIPHTRSVTNLGKLEPGQIVNLEFDILAKYIERMLIAQRCQ